MEPGQDWKVAALTFTSCVHFLFGCDKMDKDKYYMSIALREAEKAYKKGEVPVGTIIVYQDKIISKGYNKREKFHDITRHAELIAIKKASKKIRDWRLCDMTMYVTLFPCPMCASAIVQSRIKKLVIGAPTIDDKNKLIVYKILEGNKINSKVEVVNDVLIDDCKEILSKFFKKQRKKRSANI